ncbi:MAG: nucleotidyl transferase AbiEii/AbiGii toxin family protein [Bacteroidota bacterium]
MLQTQAVDAKVLGLIRQLQSLPYMKDFYLVGGTADGISLLSMPDIAAMKLNAISLNGQRVKDFIDIYFLLEKYSIGQMLGFYRKKYTLQNDTIVLKSLAWFEDVELADWPVIIKEPKLTWTKVKKRLQQSLKGI